MLETVSKTEILSTKRKWPRDPENEEPSVQWIPLLPRRRENLKTMHSYIHIVQPFEEAKETTANAIPA
jgi:hypothetical protein